MHMESVVSIDSPISGRVVTVVFDDTLAKVKVIFDEAKSEVPCIPGAYDQFRPVSIVTWQDILRTFVAGPAQAAESA